MLVKELPLVKFEQDLKNTKTAMYYLNKRWHNYAGLSQEKVEERYGALKAHLAFLEDEIGRLTEESKLRDIWK